MPYGDWIAYEPAVLVGPLRAVRADGRGGAVAPAAQSRRDGGAVARRLGGAVPAPLSSTASVLGRRCPGCSTCCSDAPARRSARRARQPPSTPLLAVITPGLDPARRVRWLRALLVVLALVYFMVGRELARCRRRDLRGHGGRDQADPRRPSVRTPAAGHHPRRHLPDPQLRAVHAAGAGGTGELAVGLGRRRARGRGPGGTRRRLGRVQDRPPAPPPGAVRRRPAEVEEAGLRAALAWLAFPAAADHRVDRDDRHRARGDAGSSPCCCGAARRRARECSRIAGWFKLAPCCARARCRWRRCAAAGSPGRSPRSRSCRCRWSSCCWRSAGCSGPAEMIHAVSYQFSRGSRAVLLERARDRRRPAARRGVRPRSDRRGGREAPARAERSRVTAPGWPR